MDCPNCKLVNPPNALRCDCGYDFATGALANANQEFERRHTRVWRLLLGAFLLLLVAAGGTQRSELRQRDLAGALGRLTGILLFLVPGVWLIASGLPKTIGLDKRQRRTRRRIWYALAGTGFFVMLATSLLLAYSNFFVGSFLMTCGYWFGWIWISWLMADKKAVQRFR